jgi:DNA repair protein RadC
LKTDKPKKSYTIRDLPLAERPRERLQKFGAEALSAQEILALLLDTRNQLIKMAEISVGSLDASIIHPREVYKEAIAASAASVIFVHNHPSGDPTASEDDIRLT